MKKSSRSILSKKKKVYTIEQAKKMRDHSKSEGYELGKLETKIYYASIIVMERQNGKREGILETKATFKPRFGDEIMKFVKFIKDLEKYPEGAMVGGLVMYPGSEHSHFTIALDDLRDMASELARLGY